MTATQVIAPQGATPPKPAKRRNGVLTALKGHVDLFLNAGSLIATTAITSLLGFVFWWVAARAASPEAVGQASAAVSAMTLIGTIGMFGMGTMLISDLSQLRGPKWELISTCLLVAGAAATVGGIAYVAVAQLWIPGLQEALGGQAGTVLLVVGIAVNAITLVLDEALVGLLKGPLQLMRNAWFAMIKLVLLAALAVAPITLTGNELLLTWVAGIVLSTAILSGALRRRGLIDSLRPRLSLLKGRGRSTFDHNLLNLASYLPRAAMPLLVTAVLSASANASFYTAFMVLSMLSMIPGNVALTLFAVASGDRKALQSKVRVGLLICVGVGLPGSLLVVLLANPIMSVFGASYADAAGDALRILALTYIPFVFLHFFLAISRVNNKVRGAGVFALIAGAAELVAAWYGGSHGGLTELVAWFAVVLWIEAICVAPTVLRVVFSNGQRRGDTANTTTMTLHERAWLPLEYIRTVGPVYGVTVDGMRKALIGLHAADPKHRAVSKLDRVGARWEHMNGAEFAQFVHRAVQDSGDWSLDMDGMTRKLQSEPRGVHPIRILVGAGYVAIKVSHAYGDAGPVNSLVHELVLAASQGRAAVIPPLQRNRMALPKAWWKQFGTKPTRWKEGISFARPPEPEETRMRKWQPNLTVRTARSATALKEMRKWRDEYAPGVTTSAITFAAFTAALYNLGLKPDTSGATFLADGRRYLDKDVRIDSNFCMGPYLSPADMMDPLSVHTTIKHELATGRILTMMVLREGKIALDGAPGMPDPYPSELPIPPRPKLTFSNQGRHDLLGDLPWSVGPEWRVNLSVPTLNSPEGVTLTTSEMNGVLHLEATFHASTFDPNLISRALELVITDPAGQIMSVREVAA
ncbi:lipopolysaccharide biosynthesis protein [Paractinoplanes atraurantiacus]|uniref:Membrane protein involved in the export of O-antigen and teichoic acid n=1 Tax=Paractinoplanes atraurantiacus TaxID=1036182 RepID=A0A285H3V6_9ACTN|nr:lipopolysaccharide biosynthesis protein [Actinoplanes atraurantiacus]SNY30452.1 Membrane protein involved in the export of O-antigen and teichoic acid [Actinoplanes atraurantiacus]